MITMGKISYTNILPVYHFFDETSFKDHVNIIPQIPAQLNQQMEEGKIDMGPISSFAYAENESTYMLMPHLSISSKGKVRSIYLFSNKPLEALQGASIALTSSSATSAALLKIIIEYFYGHFVTYETMSPVLDKMMKEHDAALLIGDDAIQASWKEHAYPFVYDLGEEWEKLTGKIMTFAVWAIRKEVISTHADQLKEIYDAFMLSKARGKKMRTKLIVDISKSYGGSQQFWKEYFAGLNYHFTEEHKEGLEYFYQLAYKIGLLSAPSRVQLWDFTDVILPVDP